MQYYFSWLLVSSNASASGEVPPVSEWELRGYHDSYMLDTIRDTLQQQEQIGWLSCIKGFFSASWQDLASFSMASPWPILLGKTARSAIAAFA